MPLSKGTFSARFAHCNVGSWGRTHGNAIDRCERLLAEDLDERQADRVRHRLAALQLASLPFKKRVGASSSDKNDYTISYKSMKIAPKTSEWLIRRAFTEIHQKLAMNAPVVKKMKALCRRSDGKFVCRRCSQSVSHLTVAHIGRPMRSILHGLEIGKRRNIAKLFSELIASHKDVSFGIVCASCNSDLEA